MSKSTLEKEVRSYKGHKIELIYTELWSGLWHYKTYSKNGNELHKQSIGCFAEKDNALKEAENYIDKLERRSNPKFEQRNIIDDINEDLAEALNVFENKQKDDELTVKDVSNLLKQIGYKVLCLEKQTP